MSGKNNDHLDGHDLALLNTSNWTGIATTYLSLHTADPTVTGSILNEVSGGSYARTSISWAAPSGGAMSNSAAITFPTATASWGTVTHVGVHSAASGGSNMLYYGAVTTSKAVTTDDVVQVDIGNLTITET